jgi:uncharacterized protein (TIGR02271 family)
MVTKAVENTNVVGQTANPQVDNEPLVIPVIQEQVVFDKQVVETGQVRITKRIIEHEELVDVPLMREEISVERVPVNQFVEAMPSPRQEGDIMIIPVVQEQVFYQKRLLLVEELRVRKQVLEDHKPQQITLLKEEVEVSRSAPGDQNYENQTGGVK